MPISFVGYSIIDTVYSTSPLWINIICALLLLFAISIFNVKSWYRDSQIEDLQKRIKEIESNETKI